MLKALSILFLSIFISKHELMRFSFFFRVLKEIRRMFEKYLSIIFFLNINKIKKETKKQYFILNSMILL